MTEIEVEAVGEVETAPDAPSYVLYGGKGGVGKTTMAAATGLASAEAGTPTLVVSTDPAHSLSDILQRDVPADAARVHEEWPLYAAEIDPERALERAGLFGTGGEVEGLGGLEALLGGGPGDSPDALPGADEAAAMQQLLTYLDDDRFDRVVVDTAPTGHTLRLLELPAVMDSLFGRLVQFRERLGDVWSGLADTVGAGDGGGQDVDLDEARQRVERLRSVLQDPARTDFRVVTVPEELSVAEAGRLRDRLNSYGVPVDTVVVNRVMEDPDAVSGADLDGVVTPDLDDCAFCKRRWDVQRDALSAAQDLFRGAEVRRVPLLAEEVRGDRLLRVVAACLS